MQSIASTEDFVLADKLLSGVISNELFRKKLQTLETEKEEVEAILEKQGFDLSNSGILVKKCIEHIQKSSFLWQNEGISVKRMVQHTTFSGNIYYDKKNGSYRTEKVNSIFHIINSITASCGNKKADFSLDLVNKSAGVPRAGVL